MKNYKQVHECAFGRPAPLIFSDIFVTETERKVFKGYNEGLFLLPSYVVADYDFE